jgi:ribose transport system substrate-binding protein
LASQNCSLALGGVTLPTLSREALAAGEGKEHIFLSIVTQVPLWVDHRKALEDVQSVLGVKTGFTGPLDFDTAAQARQLDELVARQPAGP